MTRVEAGNTNKELQGLLNNNELTGDQRAAVQCAITTVRFVGSLPPSLQQSMGQECEIQPD